MVSAFKTKFKLLLSILIVAVAAISDRADSTSADDAGRITNGQTAVPHEFPFMVALHLLHKAGRREKWSHVCGGSLVTKRHVITAAHCIFKQNFYSVVLGAHDNTGGRGIPQPQRIQVSKWLVHPGYIISKDRKSPIKNDIAVIILQLDAKFSQDVAVIPLPKTDIDESGKSCTAIGWGRTSETGPQPKLLQKTNLPVKFPSECMQHFNTTKMHPGFSCAYGFPSGVCRGDSGGPLACKDPGNRNASASPFYLFGVASATQVPCGAISSFELSTRVGYAEQLSFVTKIINEKVTVGSGPGDVPKIAAWIVALQIIRFLY